MEVEKGECIKQDFVFLATDPEKPEVSLNIPEAENSDCCVEPCVFASDNIDPFENDKSSALWVYGVGTTNVDLVLQKWVGSVWVDLVALDNTDFGEPNLFGSISGADGSNLVAYFIDWYLVRLAHDTGTYRVKTIETTIFGNTINQYSQSWCLVTYNQYLASGSVKIEWVNTHIICGLQNGSQSFDFQRARIGGQVRLKASWFGLDTSTYERAFVKYQNKQKVWIKDEEQENYVLKTGRLSEAQHDYLKNFALKGDEIRITDYNFNNARTHIQTKVLFDGDYSPNYITGSKLSSIELNFRNEFGIERKRC